MINWYIVQTFSGFEQKVAGTIKEKIEQKELKEKISEVLVPTHEVTVVKKGKRVQRKKKYFPSYVLVKMEMNKDLYHMIKNIQKVTGFLGTTGTPAPHPATCCRPATHGHNRQLRVRVRVGVSCP